MDNLSFFEGEVVYIDISKVDKASRSFFEQHVGTTWVVYLKRIEDYAWIKTQKGLVTLCPMRALLKTKP